MSLKGKLRYKASGEPTLLQALSVDGQLASQALTAVASGRRFDARKVEGSYHLAGGSLQFSDLSLETFGGKLEASAQMKHLDTTPESIVKASVNGISLREIQRAFGGQQIPQANISGTIRGNAEAAWKGGINNLNLQAHSDLFVRAAASSRANPSAADVPVEAESVRARQFNSETQF